MEKSLELFFGQSLSKTGDVFSEIPGSMHFRYYFQKRRNSKEILGRVLIEIFSEETKDKHFEVLLLSFTSGYWQIPRKIHSGMLLRLLNDVWYGL